MKTLVTGGSGYLGNHVVARLGADNFSRRTGKDVLNQIDLDEIAEYDLVIHLAALLDKDSENADEVFETNIEGTKNVIRSMKNGAAFVFASTKDIYGGFADGKQSVDESCQVLFNGQSALEWSKLIAERYVEFYGVENQVRTCIFRMSTVYAKNSMGNSPNFVGHFADCFNMGDPISLPYRANAVRDLLHVNDFADACVAFYQSVIRNGLYNLGGGPENALSLKELFELMSEVSGYQTAFEEGDISPPPPVRYVSDLSRVRQELDWEPKIELRDGIESLFR